MVENWLREVRWLIGYCPVKRDAVGGYLFHDEQREIDHHLALGVSLGGHSVWQLLFADPRVRAGVPIIGCPDFMCKPLRSLAFTQPIKLPAHSDCCRYALRPG